MTVLRKTNSTVYLAVLSQVNALILLEVISQEVHNALVKVITTKVSVTTGGQHLKDSIANLQYVLTGFTQ